MLIEIIIKLLILFTIIVNSVSLCKIMGLINYITHNTRSIGSIRCTDKVLAAVIIITNVFFIFSMVYNPFLIQYRDCIFVFNVTYIIWMIAILRFFRISSKKCKTLR